MEWSHDQDYPKRFIAFMKRPIVIVMIVGILIRAVLMPLLTYNYDISFWATTIQNIQSDNGLYDLPGYYYSPVWGYILGFITLFIDFIPGMTSMGSFFPEAAHLGTLWWDYYTPYITTISFNVVMKIPLVISDILVAVLIYKLIQHYTEDERKATLGAGLWFLCPVVIYMSGIQAMFDTFSVLFLLLSVMLALKDRYFLAGTMIAVAIFLKLFPIYMVVILAAYALAKFKADRKEAFMKLMHGVAGALLITLIIFIPQFIEGSVTEAFMFILNRVDTAGAISSGESSIKGLFSSVGMSLVMIVQIAILLLVMYGGAKLFRAEGDLDGKFLMYAMLTTTLTFVWVPAPQYLMIMLPFLIYHAVVSDRRFMKPLAMVAVSATLFAFAMNNFSVLMSLAAYTDIVSLDYVIDIMTWIQEPVFGIPLISIIIFITGAMEGVGIWWVLLCWYQGYRAKGPEVSA